VVDEDAMAESVSKMPACESAIRNEVKPTWNFDDISHIQIYLNWRVLSLFLDTLNHVRGPGSNGLCDTVMGCVLLTMDA
jgi:hypothetical protein